ncbi:MAG: TIGR03986 family CRISPR-associated RAMP protein [Bacteroidales bacterium]|nr:TIGR03986 family CRISPR-associated RAMP protein [Bacteroidales bacterium]
MPTIKAPFNFVPVSDKVFFPDWADQISHDIPFEDGESGVIELKITAESPVFVRNGHTKADADNKNDEFKSFSKVDNKYFIPATTIKGAIRNVLEIMSLGKMRLDENAMFAQREWDNPDLYPLKAQQNNFFCGYLRRNGSDYEIVDCGKPYRIGQKCIDEQINNNIFENNFSQKNGIDINTEVRIGDKMYDPKTAAYKYKLLENYPELFELHNFEEDGAFTNEYQQNRLNFSNTGQYRGKLVLTGQPDKWKWPRPTQLDSRAGKYYEFVFLEPEHNSNPIFLSEIEFNHFKFIYSESPEWDRAKKLLDKVGIPVFFRKDNNGNVRDLGLAFLYKLPYENSPFNTLKYSEQVNNTDNRKKELVADISDCIFGYTNLQEKGKMEKSSLKGRVQISHAFSEAQVVSVTERIVTLGSPKASYYPIYIKQSGATVVEYATYNANGQISGWKRYMIRDRIWGEKSAADYNKNLDSILLPLDSGIEFTFKIRYHNLKKVELGALLSAITFHNTPTCRYQLGQGKPYGFGTVKIEITNWNTNKLNDYLYEFEKVMEKHNPKWTQSEQVKELITMASKSVSDNDDRFKYLKMDNNRDRNEFLKVKTDKEALLTYSAIINDCVTPLSLYDERIEKEYNALIDDALTLKKEEQYDEAKAKLEEAGKLYPNGNKHDELLTEINKACAEKKQKDKEKRDKDEQDERDKAKIEAGLSFLEEKNLNGVYKVQDFKGAKNRIEQWMKKAKIESLPQEQWEMLWKTLSRLYHQPDKKEQESWKNFDSPIWQTIAKYTGEENAKKWFSELSKL